MRPTAPKRTADGIMLPRSNRDEELAQLPAPRALVVLAEGAEEIEVVIPVDVLRRGGVEVVLAGLNNANPVKCGRGVIITPDIALSQVEGPFDVLVLPGGLKGAERLATSSDVGRLLRTQIEQMGLVAAMCAAPIAFIRHQVFQGKNMTCHPSVKEAVAAWGNLKPDATLVEDGELLTAAGPGAAFAFTLTILRRLQGEGALPSVIGPMMFDKTPDLPRYLQS